jgi:hypothetical protein
MLYRAFDQRNNGLGDQAVSHGNAMNYLEIIDREVHGHCEGAGMFYQAAWQSSLECGLTEAVTTTASED